MSSLGTKRRCTACGAPFYDLNHDPIVCPKCGAVHEPVARLKSDGRVRPQGRTFARRDPVPVAAEAEVPAAAEVAEGDEEEAEEKDAAEDEDEVLEADEEEERVDGEAFGGDADEPERDR